MDTDRCSKAALTRAFVPNGLSILALKAYSAFHTSAAKAGLFHPTHTEVDNYSDSHKLHTTVTLKIL